MRVAALNIFPLKSGRGIALQSARVDAFGLDGDRRWMLVDPAGKLVSQRDLPDLARVIAREELGALTLSLAGEAPLTVTVAPDAPRLDVQVWKSQVSAAWAGAEAASTLSRWLGRELQLVHFDAASQRRANPAWTGGETPLAFADGYPVLITNTASLAALNENMQAHGEGPVGMERFRPNIVLEHEVAFAEDGWTAVRIGPLLFNLVKPCERCIMTTQDQQTGSREMGSPMPAMGRIRMSADRRVPGLLFGWNAVPVGEGSIAVGDPFEIVAEREPWAFKRRG